MDRACLEAEIAMAMRAHDKPRLSILRLVKNEIVIKEKESQGPATAADVVATLKKLLKQTAETHEGSVKAGTDPVRTALLAEQIAILAGYLPDQVAGDALAAVVKRVLADGGFAEKRDMARAISAVVAECGGNCDKAEVARLVGPALM